MEQHGITTAELARITAGGDGYIRTSKNQVVGLALTKKKNPDAPEIVVFGRGPRIERTAELLLEQGRAVPTYMKEGTKNWVYVGNYKAKRISRAVKDIAEFGASRPDGSVAGILFLERQDSSAFDIEGKNGR